MSSSASLPHLLKIDVDGFEERSCEGGERTLGDANLRSILLEISGFGKPEEDPLVNRLREFGFRVERVFPVWERGNVLFRRLEASSATSTSACGVLELYAEPAPAFDGLSRGRRACERSSRLSERRDREGESRAPCTPPQPRAEE